MTACRMFMLALALVTVLPAASESIRPGLGGVQKVIEMLTKMQNTCKQEKMDEQVAMGKFEEWCKNKIPFMKKEIVKNGETIEALTAEIGELDVDIKTLGEEIEKHQKEIETAKASQKKETAEREKEHKDFLAEEQDYAESVDALERALDVMKKQDYDRPGTAAMLMQLNNQRNMPDKVKSIVSAFAQMLDGKSESDAQAPEAHAYDFQSGGIIQVLKNLLDEFREKLGTCQKEEMNSQAAYDMIMFELTDTVENAETDIADKSKRKASKEERRAEAKKEKEEETKMKAENEKTLASMEVECKEKKYSFAEKQDLRTQEIAAIGKAIEILKSDDVMGSAEKHMELAQKGKKHTALVQLRGKSASATQGPLGRRLRKFLESEASRLHNTQLSLLAQKVGAYTSLESGDDPFAKVKAMIDAMITRLIKEQNADAEHEGFCDKEMGKNKVTRTKLSEDIDMLTAECDEGKAFIIKNTEDIADLSKEVEELDVAMAEATQLRKEEKAKNLATIEDAKAAQAAVDAASKVLKDFYEKAATATAFVQIKSVSAQEAPQFGLTTDVRMGTDEWNALATPEFDGVLQEELDTGHKEGMQTMGKKYNGMQSSANGVLALMEVVLSDFAKLQADTENAEAMNQKSYEEFMIQSKRDKATAEKSIEMKTADKIEAEKKLAEDTADLKNNQDELIAADKYYEKLVPQCVDQGMTWEERRAAQQSEIDSLKEALKILSNPDIATTA